MCSYGSIAKGAGGAMNQNLRRKEDQEPDRPRKLNRLEKKLGLSTREEDVAFVITAQKGLIDTLGDILAHRPGDQRRPTDRNVVVRVGSRASGKPSTALHEAAKHGHADCCQLLIEHGCDVNFKLQLSRVLIPLHYAKTTQVCHVLLRAGSFSRRQRSDKRLPDMAKHARTQKREEVAIVIDEWNIAAQKKRGRRVHARVNLQMIWDRLNGMVVGLRRIRQFQLEFTEKFYSPDYGGFMKVGAARFEEFSSGQLQVEVEPEILGPEDVKDMRECGAGSGLKAALLLRQAHKSFPIEQQKPIIASPLIQRPVPTDPRNVGDVGDVSGNGIEYPEIPSSDDFVSSPFACHVTSLQSPPAPPSLPPLETVESFVDCWYVAKCNLILGNVCHKKCTKL